MSSKNVLLIGLHPDVVDYAKWPDLSPDRLVAAMEADKAAFATLGYEAEVCFVDLGETAEQVTRAALERREHGFVLIGAGVRTSADNFLLFEKLVNVAHRCAPAAKLCFNTGPTDSIPAVLRWA